MQAKWFWFEQFRHGDINSTAYQRQIIDTFVDSVYIFDDRVALNFKDTSKIVTREEVLGSGAFFVCRRSKYAPTAKEQGAACG